jgi:hypothetical protein
MDLGFAGVILGAVIAGIVAIGGEYLRSRHESELDSTKRADDRRIERDRLQVQTLLELQERLTEWLDRVSDQMSTELLTGKGTDIEIALAPDANRRVRDLVERVRDDDLRGLLDTLLSTVARVRGEASWDGGPSLTEDFAEISRDETAARKRLGEVLRGYL